MALKNEGDERLFSREEWIEEQEIQGSPELVFNSPLMNNAQERILEQFTPRHPIALVSWCTTSRPYTKSPKWKTFIKELSGVDFLVASNAGIIPLEYEGAYPYLTYDAHHEREFDELFLIYMTRFFIRFFTLKQYDYVIINSSPNQRQRKRKASLMAGRWLKKRNHIRDFEVCPSPEVYGRAKFNTMFNQMFPDIEATVLGDMKTKIAVYQDLLERD